MIAAGCVFPLRGRDHSPGAWQGSQPLAPSSGAHSGTGSIASASAGSASIDCATPPLSSLSPDARAALVTVRSGFVSLGHAGGQFSSTVRVNAIGARSRAGAGALWVAEHKRAADEVPGPVLAMERRASSRDTSHAEWCYIVAEPDGTVLRSGSLADCAGCHAAAPSESIFTTGAE